MSEMIERVARAIAKASGDDPDGLTGSLLNEGEKYWQHYVGQSRAAIEAMRDSTSVMINAARDAELDIYWGYLSDGRPGGPADVWKIMIDAALK